MYERLAAAEQNTFYNSQTGRLNLLHFSKLLEIVEFMHGHGVIHQDIRAANIAFRGDEPVLLDFAFASIKDGSPAYKAGLRNRSDITGYCGTGETASGRILKLFNEGREANIKVLSKDDLISLYKLWFCLSGGCTFLDRLRTMNEFYAAWLRYTHITKLEGQSKRIILETLRETFSAHHEDHQKKLIMKDVRSGSSKHVFAKHKSVVYHMDMDADYEDLTFDEWAAQKRLLADDLEDFDAESETYVDDDDDDEYE